MPMPTEVLLAIYFALMFSLAMIVRQAYVRCRDWPRPRREDLEQIRSPYSPPPDRRQRTFDWTTHRYRQDSVG